MASVDRRISGDSLPRVIDVAKDTTTSVLAKGDLICLSSGEAVIMGTTTDNLTFIGVAESASASGATYVRVALADGKTEWDYPLDTATTLIIGDGLVYSASATLSHTSTDAIAICTKAGSSLTTARCVFKVPLLLQGDMS